MIHLQPEMGMLRAFVLGIVFTLIAIAAAAYFGLRAGAIPVAADAPALPLEESIAGIDLTARLRKDAPKGPNPIALTDANLAAGIRLYGDHCVICHGTAAGEASASPVAKGQYPRPPQLAKDGVEDDPEGWTFWKIKHGIRWTGMPSWKGELNDRQIWTLALFLKHMDKLPAGPEAAWRAIVGAPKPGHQAAPGSPGEQRDSSK